MSTIKVFANSPVFSVAADIAGIIRDHQQAELHAIEEEAVNQALKAVDLAIVYFRKDEIAIHCKMESADKTIDENVQPVIRLIVEAPSSLDRSFELTRKIIKNN
jgi:stage V sporulation protein SpoVS